MEAVEVIRRQGTFTKLIRVSTPLILNILLPQLPPSINEMYATVNGRRVKSVEAKGFAETTAWWIHSEYPGFTIPKTDDYLFVLACYYPLDRLKSNDSDNRLKAAKDAVFNASRDKANDSWVKGDLTSKEAGEAGLLAQYPHGYCKIILARLVAEETNDA